MIQRQSDDLFDAAPSVVACAVRATLAHSPPYRNTIETQTDSLFQTNVKPSWLLLGTDMAISLEPSSGGTKVEAKTQSQWFILGDVLGYYNKYIRNFLGDLRIELQKQKTSE